MKIQVIIPFRDRGVDPRRAANLEVVMAWWYAHGFDPRVVDDGLEGDAQFNRHRAYNRAVSRFPETDVYVFTEADMLIHPEQVYEAAQQAASAPGLVVPFTQYRYLSDETTAMCRTQFFDHPTEDTARWWSLGVDDRRSVFGLIPESTMDNGKSIGAVNVFSRSTLEQVGGFTESTRGNWYDDNIIELTYSYLAGPTRWVDGPAVHLYHLPGHRGEHLTDADRRATAHNKNILASVNRAIRQRDQRYLRKLMRYRVGHAEMMR